MCVNFSEIKCIIDAFGSHLDIDLQQRSVEFSQLFKAHKNLRPALLEKMPPMQITRVSNQNSEFNEESESGELILNGSDDDQENKKIATSDSVSENRTHFQFSIYANDKMFSNCFAFVECLIGSSWWQ